VDEERDFGAHGKFDDRSHAHSIQLWVDQRRDWILLAGVVGGVASLVRRGPGKFWRGGLLGLAAGTLGALGLAALGRPDQQPRNLGSPDAHDAKEAGTEATQAAGVAADYAHC
jgi:hypothetical protein